MYIRMLHHDTLPVRYRYSPDVLPILQRLRANSMLGPGYAIFLLPTFNPFSWTRDEQQLLDGTLLVRSSQSRMYKRV